MKNFFAKIISKLFALSKVRFDGDHPPVKQMYHDFFSIAWPSILEGALVSIIGSVDTMMVGNSLGTTGIAAVGLTGQPRMILLIIIQALCVGTTALVARRKGANDQEAANQAFGQSFTFVTLLGLVIMALGYFCAPWLMELSGANEETMDLSVTYFRIISMGFVFNAWSLNICAAMRAIGKPKITLVTNITANLVNVCLNYCLIEGHFGFPALGVAGAAIATAIGTAISSFICLFVATRPKGYLKLKFRYMFNFDKRTINGLTSVGSSSIAESAFLRIGFLITNKMIAGIGTIAFASYQIVTQVTSLSFTLGDGLATAGATLVGQSLGAQRPDKARANVVIARKLSFVTSIFLIIMILLFNRQLGMLFMDKAEPMYEETLHGVSLALLAVILGIIPQNGRVVYSGCLRGAGDTKFVAWCSLISVCVVRSAFTWFFCYPMRSWLPILALDVTGPWLAFVVDAYIRNAMLAQRIRKGKWLTIKL